ncbi:Alpha/beta hydrolase fold protein [Hyella patelloides LEGE 07179]|uniref:Alpha/beta hydrolase fold protein n=1 Tax=Hyella patelloides LEGE 07179 TaxID=945734 RepID=A0A563W1X9_9CYAN|nr:alpha/beta hydrolase [Hyella patelloides]VEP17637.1 Alpha/beta hydrolase fold protein [Hyella patelloides LEGE 07179]
MFPNFLPQEVHLLENSESIFLAKSIKRYPTLTPLFYRAIATAYTKLGITGLTPPILLLHGFDSSLLEFRRLIPLLAAKRETWAVDLLGSGFTERLPNISYNPHSIKEHLYSFWHSLINRPVILVGVSMGGATAIDFTLSYPEAVAKLVLINSVGYSGSFPIGKLLPDPMVEFAVEFWRQRRNFGLFWGKSLGLLDFPTEDVIRCAALPSLMPGWSRAINDFTRSGGYYRLRERIPLVNKPTLILWGERDDVLGTEVAYLFKNAISKSQLVWLRGLGHSPQWEQPESVARQILEFIGG